MPTYQLTKWCARITTFIPYTVTILISWAVQVSRWWQVGTENSENGNQPKIELEGKKSTQPLSLHNSNVTQSFLKSYNWKRKRKSIRNFILNTYFPKFLFWEKENCLHKRTECEFPDPGGRSGLSQRSQGWEYLGSLPGPQAVRPWVCLHFSEVSPHPWKIIQSPYSVRFF